MARPIPALPTRSAIAGAAVLAGLAAAALLLGVPRPRVDVAVAFAAAICVLAAGADFALTRRAWAAAPLRWQRAL
ncbi:MAG TPA: DUF58 domain-containing protein, partial [Caldimonas sp.]